MDEAVVVHVFLYLGHIYTCLYACLQVSLTADLISQEIPPLPVRYTLCTHSDRHSLVRIKMQTHFLKVNGGRGWRALSVIANLFV